MSKIGVGVGEEFPLDEEARAKQEDVADDERFCAHDFRAARRHAWRKFRRQMREEWHARRHAFREARRDARRDGVEAIHDLHGRHLHHLVVGGLAMIGLAALFGILRHRD